MVGLILPALLGAGLALVMRRRDASSAPVSLRWRPVAVLALGTQLVLFTPPLDQQPWALTWGPWVYVASLVGVCAVLVRSALASGVARQALLLAALGVGLNLGVVTANGGYMPQSRAARQTITAAPIGTDRLSSVVPLTADSRLPWLADVIPQPSWTPLANVLSIGDLLLGAGIGWGTFLWVGGRRRSGAGHAATAEAVPLA
jgi:Family of unknown function (DUF5317)